jgi:Galactose-3-O-sulfotransferase
MTRTARNTGGTHARERLLIFLHIPKTAGSTVLRILEREYGQDAVLRAYEANEPAEVAAALADARHPVRVLAGHFPFGIDDALPAPASYMTFLRDPVDRVRSHYDFVRTQPEHYLHDAACSLKLPEYVRRCGAAEPNNDQTRLLSGARADTAYPGMLPLAKSNVDRLGAIGLTEDFDASLILLRRAYRWRRPYYARRNVRRPEHRNADTLSPDVRAVILAHNALDADLYEYARDRFRRHLAEQAGDFERELRRFRRLNAIYAGSRLDALAPLARIRS